MSSSCAAVLFLRQARILDEKRTEVWIKKIIARDTDGASDVKLHGRKATSEPPGCKILNEKLQNIVKSTYAIVLSDGIKLQYLQEIKILRGTFSNKGPALP